LEGATVADLSRALVADEIARVRNERWSGVLALSQGEVSKGLYFLEGEIAFAASTVEEDRLGACLFRAGRLTESQFRAAMREVEASGFPLGYVLVESRVLSRQELSGALSAQVERIVLSVLRWTSGTLRREAMDRPIPADQALDLSTNRLLLLGMRLFPDAERLERALGEPSRRLRRVSPPPFDYEQVESSPAERAALALCSRGASIGDLLSLPHARPQMVRAVHALQWGGLIEDAPLPRPAAPPAPTPFAAAPAYVPETQPEPEPELEVPRSAEEAEKLARRFLERGHRERAIEILRAAIGEHPAARAPRRLLALTLGREAGFQKDVEKLFVELLEGDSSDTELRYALASYYRKGGLAGRAIIQLRLVLSADSSHAAAWRDLGELEAGPGPARRGR
jgi:tetratricopeptide (TPR) repeat protein